MNTWHIWEDARVHHSTRGRTGRADLHVHTDASDGTASVREVLREAARIGLDVVAITDHDTIEGALEARRLGPAYGVEVIVGEEVSTVEGHLLALFVEEALPAGRPAAETIAAARAQGGLCIAPHPYDWTVPSLGRVGLRHRCHGPDAGEWPLDAIEGLNASATWPAGVVNAAAQRLARHLGLPSVGGSDAHTLATIGKACTLFPGQTAADVREAIRLGNVEVAGQACTTAETLDFYRLTVRQRGLRAALALAWSNLAIRSSRQRPDLASAYGLAFIPPLSTPGRDEQFSLAAGD
jgi:predicted metal-dependent phosphoesterase TrpH